MNIFRTILSFAACYGLLHAAPANDGKSRAADFETALRLVKAGAFADAQDRLFASNVQRVNTVAYDIESADKLVHLAAVLRENLDYSNAEICLHLALNFLDASTGTHRLEAAAGDLAEMYELKGYILLKYLNDDKSATDAYTAALKYNPSSKAATRGLAAIQLAEKAKTRALGH